MIKYLKILIPFAFILGLTIVLFRPVLSGLLPLPLDALVGSYFPWLDSKWGYAVGVPVKNPALSDVYSQQYPWQSLSADLLRSGQMPLWNPYAFAGTPLLANWQSAPFYPLRLLMVFLGNSTGHSLSVVLQVLLSLSFMYLFLRRLKLATIASLSGSVIFALSGFMMTKLEYNLDGQVLLWIPLALYLIEVYSAKEHPLIPPLLSFIIYAILTAGFFQPAFYGLAIIFLYLLTKKNIFWTLVIFLVLGIGLASLQLLPSLELFRHSIRSLDHNITEYQFGLLPLANLSTLLAPDFFGNPVTNNFWGFMQYQETSGYFSIIALPFILLIVVSRKRTPFEKFFLVFFFFSLLFAFANPISQLIYALKIPLLSSGYASRWLTVTTLSASVLVATGLHRLRRPTDISKFVFYTFLSLLTVSSVALVIRFYLTADPTLRSGDVLAPVIRNLSVSLRNALLPFGLITLLLVGSKLVKKPIFILLVLSLITFDLSRYFIKFTPFTPTGFLDWELPTFSFLDKELGIYRVDKEAVPLLPANTWTYQHYQSASGYDPLVFLPYATFYKLMIGQIPKSASELESGAFNRYLNLENYHSLLIDLSGIKYLLALKRNDIDVFTPAGTKITPQITAKYQPVLEDKTTVILENKNVHPRVSLYGRFRVVPDQFQAQLDAARSSSLRDEIILDRLPLDVPRLSASDTATIVAYHANAVEIRTQTANSAILLLTDTFYPGWVAEVDGVEKELLLGFGIFRALEVPPGDHRVLFAYRPQSFSWGVLASLASLAAIILLTGLLLSSKLKRRWAS